ncbi:MAG TPA: MoaD/ThiS family protein [bacterium]|jgi:molybdopterin converting factor small subunit|nr:MoaD/ThiS family protein [bacterium]
MATVRIPTPMRRYTNGERVTTVSAGTLAGAIEELGGRYPGLADRLVDGSGQLHQFVNVFVNNQDVRLLEGLATPLDDRAEISIIPAMAGGCGGICVSTPYGR